MAGPNSRESVFFLHGRLCFGVRCPVQLSVELSKHAALNGYRFLFNLPIPTWASSVFECQSGLECTLIFMTQMPDGRTPRRRPSVETG